MEPNTPQQQIELFHLLFLAHLSTRVDKSFYVLKGGCNLRFFFKSIRYSEDIDLDVRTVAKDTLKTQVSKFLVSSPFQAVLQTRKLRIAEVTAPKQTDTTQRWKLKIHGPGSSLPIATKIEFSRRGMKTGFEYSPIDADITRSYQLYPVLANHYQLDAAFSQKVSALIHRAETQARDVFDLDLLLKAGANSKMLPFDLKSQLSDAVENAMSISYTDYKSQVVAYLDASNQEFFSTKAAWNQIQESVINHFENAVNKP